MAHGTYVPLIAFLVSCLGCGLGLACTNQAQVGTRGSRNRWLFLSAVSIGGTGIWGMHFVSMLGVTVHGSLVRWDVTLTVLSLVIAIVVVGAGMFLVGYGAPGLRTLLPAGVITGCGVAAMHYTGMAAMRVQGSIGYDMRLVALSVVIAVVAATTALWITRNVRRALAMVVAIPIMGVAVCGMHYTGMIAARLTLSTLGPIPGGEESSTFIFPLMIWIIGSAFITLLIVVLAPSTKDVLEDQHFQKVTAELRGQRS